jgi:hypothetical protein
MSFAVLMSACTHGTAMECKDARIAVATMERLAAERTEPDQMEAALPMLCRELETCAGRCGELMRFMALVEWRSVDEAGLDHLRRGARRDGCSEFAAALEGAPMDELRAIAFGWGVERAVVFLRASCARVSSNERQRLSRAMAKLGIAPGGDFCSASGSSAR